MENFTDLEHILNELENVHYPAGPVHQKVHRYKAQKLMEENELQAIYHLVESHVPSLRFKTVLRYEKIFSTNTENICPSLRKSYVELNCANTNNKDNIQRMLTQIEEMPKEWTIVQFTPHFNSEENFEIHSNQHYTNAIHLTVIQCGCDQMKPFCVSADAPINSDNGSVIELAKEMHFIINSNKDCLLSSKSQQFFKNNEEKLNYRSNRYATDQRLKNLIDDIQNLWLKEWRCLLIAKYINSNLDELIKNKIQEFFLNEAPHIILSERIANILHCIVKGCCYLKLTELRRAVLYCFPEAEHKNLHKNLLQFIRNLSIEYTLIDEKKHPVILVIDDTLDLFPWEMIDVLQNEPVSRMPSLYMLYALFKEHESTIQNGHKIIKKYQNGTYIINPDLDLKNMENRVISFLKYWVPDWKGLTGTKPTEEEFEKMLLSGEIFIYSGHGSGTQFFGMEKIQSVHIEAVILLFGCGSSKLINVGPQAEMYGTHQMYLIACSPCVIGMLWEVTDLDTDILTTEFMSTWIPSNAQTDWKYVKKEKWKKGEIVNFSTQTSTDNQEGCTNQEIELLRALSLSKKSRPLVYNLTRAACVARGIPVKIEIVEMH